MPKTTLNLRVDSKLKKDAERVVSRLGLTMSGAIVLYLNALVRSNGVPFDIKAYEKTKRKTKKTTSLKSVKKASNKNAKKGKEEELEFPSVDSIKAALSKL